MQTACEPVDSLLSPFSCCLQHNSNQTQADNNENQQFCSWPQRGRETPMTREQQRLTFTSRGPLFDIVLRLMRSSCPQHQHSAPHRHEKRKKRKKEKRREEEEKIKQHESLSFKHVQILLLRHGAERAARQHHNQWCL